MTASSKIEMRKVALKARKGLSREELLKLSGAVMKNVISSPEYMDSKVIATYVSKSDEVKTEGIIRHSLKSGKRVLVPVSQPESTSLVFSELRDYERELAPGHFGVQEPISRYLRPVPLGEADLILVPLVAWDDRGYRLGFGKGYFDSALAGAGVSSMTMGLGLESQRMLKIPEEKHDVPLMAIVTERRIVRIGSERKG
ncbi:MAG: 5-formyltetrahydrofolate cyclo-ligase [Nitrososphaerales archaeon]